jgi:putative membrane protein
MTDLTTARRNRLLGALVVLLSLLIVSGLHPYERSTWWLEIMPILIAIPILVFTARRFELTPLVYMLIFIQSIILMVGGAYTYARVPLGFELQHWLSLSRNPYDKIGHLAQGIVPAMIAREILIRGRYVNGRAMLNFIVVCIALAISACYEFIEWFTALAMGQGADDFLGTQGDIWDTQSDMFCALLGAILALIVLSGLHDRQLGRQGFASSRK